MPDGHFAGLREYTDDTARQPDFDVIRRRAARVRRRRRMTVPSVVAGLMAVVVAAIGLSTGQGDGQPAAWPSRTPDGGMDGVWPGWAHITAAKADELYALYHRCRDCDAELRVSADGGRTWSRRTLPPQRTSDIGNGRATAHGLEAVAPGVLWLSDMFRTAAASERMTVSPSGSLSGELRGTVQRFWITLDGGRSWQQRPSVDERPVEAVPAGSRAVDCQAVRREETPCRLYAVNPDTGRFAPLANQPTGLRDGQGASFRTDVPADGRLWVPGLDVASGKPAVATSPDRGRTWTTYVFTDGVPADYTFDYRAFNYLPTIAAGDGATAYALTYRPDRKHDSYRTTDGGATWERVPGGPIPEIPDPGFVTTDGAHVVNTGSEVYAFRPGGDRYAPVTLPGYPGGQRHLGPVTVQQATGLYLNMSDEIWRVSDDGWTWRRIALP